ncbi:hypothetical protein [Streptomyces sp. NPDC002587]
MRAEQQASGREEALRLDRGVRRRRALLAAGGAVVVLAATGGLGDPGMTSPEAAVATP